MKIKPLESYVKSILVHFPIHVIRSTVGFVTQNLRTTAGRSGSCVPGEGWLQTGASSHRVITLWAKRQQAGPQHCVLCSQMQIDPGWDNSNGDFLVAFRPLLVSEVRGLPDRGFLQPFTFSWPSGPGLATLRAFLSLSSPISSQDWRVPHALLSSLWLSHRTLLHSLSKAATSYSAQKHDYKGGHCQPHQLLLSWVPDGPYIDLLQGLHSRLGRETSRAHTQQGYCTQESKTARNFQRS